MPVVSKNISDISKDYGHLGNQGPRASHVVLKSSVQKSIGTGATGHYTVPIIVDDRVGDSGKIWKAGVIIMKGADVPTEDWDNTGIVSLAAVKLQKVSPVGESLTTITSKGNWFSGKTLTTILDISAMAAGIGTLIDNADEIAYWEIDRENFPAQFSNNAVKSHDLLRFYIQIGNASAGTVTPIVMPFVFIDRLKV